MDSNHRYPAKFFWPPADPRAIHLPQYKPAPSRQGPMVRIHLSPAASQRRTPKSAPLRRSSARVDLQETRAAPRTVFPPPTAELLTFWRDRMPSDARSLRRRGVGWVTIHWFELGTLALLCLNLWFVSTVLNALRETNRWLAFLTRVRWDETGGPESPPSPP